MNLKMLNRITGILLVLATISCLWTIFRNDMYQDGEWANAQWLGQDVVTLLLATPLLAMARYYGIQKSGWRWQLVFSGVLFYFVYTYAFFMFAANLTVFYLLHFPIFGLSVIGLFLSLRNNFQEGPPLHFSKKGLKATIIGYLLLISAMIVFIWAADIFAHLTIAGHQSATPDGKAPLIIYSLDLAIVIPLMVTAAIGFWKNKGWGYTLTGVMLVKTSTLGFALMAMALSMYLQKLDPETFLIMLWSVIGVIGTILTFLFLKNLSRG
jgi:hypothetical protein